MARPAKSTLNGLTPDLGRIGNDNAPQSLDRYLPPDLGDGITLPMSEPIDGLAEIAAFPSHAFTEVPHAAVPALEAVPVRSVAQPLPGRKRLTAACCGSFLFHSALFAALLFGAVTTPEPAEEGAAISVMMLGSSDLDQLAAGQKTEEPQPETVTAEAVEPHTVQPAAAEPNEVQPVATEQNQAHPLETESVMIPTVATVETPKASAQPFATVEPSILATLLPAEQNVVQPPETQLTAAIPSEAPVPPAAVEAQLVVAAVPETLTPLEKKAEKPVEKRRDQTVKALAKPARVRGGFDGRNETQSNRGSSAGQAIGRSDHNSETASDRAGAGSAAVANYPGKIQSKIQRSVRVPAAYKRAAQSITVRVRLTIGAGGDLASLSVVRGSGNPELDSSVMAGVRRAAPFPPLPAEWGKASWSFNQDVQIAAP